MQSYEAEPLTCGIWNYLQVGSVRINSLGGAGKNTHWTMPHPSLSWASEQMKVAMERASEVPRITVPMKQRQDSNWLCQRQVLWVSTHPT